MQVLALQFFIDVKRVADCRRNGDEILRHDLRVEEYRRTAVDNLRLIVENKRIPAKNR